MKNCKCEGFCLCSRLTAEQEEQRRAQTVGLTETMISQVELMIHNKHNELRVELNKEILKVYKKAWKSGFKSGNQFNKKFDF